MTDPKAMEADDAEVMRIWRQCGLPEYFLGNGGSNHKLVAFAKACALLAGEGNSVAAAASPRPSTAEALLREALGTVVIKTTLSGIESKETLASAIKKAMGWGHFDFVLTDAALDAIAAAIAGKDASDEKAGLTQASDSLARPSPSPAVRGVTLRDEKKLREGLENVIAFADEMMRLGSMSGSTCERIVVIANAALSHPSLPDGEGNQ